jgi:predicted TIM-barrel fold metal-dependent hydrolase
MAVDVGQPVAARAAGLEPFDTRKLLVNAARQAEERNYADFLIVDSDAHHYESTSWAEIFSYVEDPVVRQRLEAASARTGGRPGLLPSQIGDQDVAGRIKVSEGRRAEVADSDDVHPDVTLTRRYMSSMGIDHSVIMPTPMLNLSPHPQPEIEVAMARAYARWISDRILSVDDAIKAMLYMPFNDPEASLRLVEEFGDVPGVAGFMVTSCRYRPVHHNAYMPVYAALEKKRRPIGFHAVYNWQERALEQLNRFMSVHALAFPFYNMIHLTNWIVNGIPERFPELKVIWIESGIAWIPFMMDRLDHEYLMRSSEAPMLTKMPSDYIREMHFTTQPMERVASMDQLASVFEKINAEESLLYSSDYPHWDFDLPSVIYDLPFLSEHAKRRILGENAREVFGL